VSEREREGRRECAKEREGERERERKRRKGKAFVGGWSEGRGGKEEKKKHVYGEETERTGE